MKGEQVVVNETNLANDEVEDPSAILDNQYVAQLTREPQDAPGWLDPRKI